jgi:hypothetical protein
MTNQLPITPSLELVASLRSSAPHGIRDAGVTRERWLIEHAYAAGADHELEACKQYMHDQDWFMSPTLRMTELHNARRPKPRTLKEQALSDLDTIQTHDSFGFQIIELSTIRRAIEALPND